MIINPVEEVLKKTSSLPFPLPTATASATATPVLPVPSVIPDPVDHQVVGDDGKKTLWVVFVIMVIASAAFAAMSWRVPVVRCNAQSRWITGLP